MAAATKLGYFMVHCSIRGKRMSEVELQQNLNLITVRKITNFFRMRLVVAWISTSFLRP